MINCTLQTGGKVAEWGIGKVLMSMYEFLHRAPSRRPDYLELVETSYSLIDSLPLDGWNMMWLQIEEIKFGILF